MYLVGYKSEICWSCKELWSYIIFITKINENFTLVHCVILSYVSFYEKSISSMLMAWHICIISWQMSRNEKRICRGKEIKIAKEKYDRLTLQWLLSLRKHLPSFQLSYKASIVDPQNCSFPAVFISHPGLFTFNQSTYLCLLYNLI